MKVELVQAVCGNNEATGAVILDRFMPSGGALGNSIRVILHGSALAHSLTVLREE